MPAKSEGACLAASEVLTPMSPSMSPVISMGGGGAAPLGAQVFEAADSRASQGCSWMIAFPM